MRFSVFSDDEYESVRRRLAVPTLLSLAAAPEKLLQGLDPTSRNKAREIAMKIRAFSRTIEEAEHITSTFGFAKLIRSGCPGIDDILGGGVRAGVPLAVVGAGGAGKTQFAYQFVAIALRTNPALRALWLDPTSSFRPERLHEIASNRGCDAADILRRVLIRRTVGSEAQRSIIRLLIKDLPRNVVLVIDDVYSNFETDYPGLNNSILRYATLRSHLLDVANLTYRQSMFALVVFPVRFRPEDVQLVAAGQPPYFNLPSQLWFHREGSTRYVTYSLKPGWRAKIRISALGVQDV